MANQVQKALSKKELANMYNVSVWVLRKWLKPHTDKIGAYIGRTYTPVQVQRIFELIGEP